MNGTSKGRGFRRRAEDGKTWTRGAGSNGERAMACEERAGEEAADAGTQTMAGFECPVHESELHSLDMENPLKFLSREATSSEL